MNIDDESLDDILRRFKVRDMFALHCLYVKKDQYVFKSGRWNYRDHRLVVNKIKSALERLPDERLGKHDRVWKIETLWFWHHHAISIAINRGDIKLARIYSDEALRLQGRDHPNKITRLLWYLLHGRVRQAKRWIRDGVKRPEIGTAKAVLGWYEDGWFSVEERKGDM